MITYDSEYGDAIVFDNYKFTAESYEDMLACMLARFDLLLKERTLIIDCEGGFTNIVETQSGKTA